MTSGRLTFATAAANVRYAQGAGISPCRGAARRCAAAEVAPGLRRALAGAHVVFFREDAAAVTVIRVLHQRMDVARGE
ncbi:type II toxin-antitoxin system RelE/ParE family toxin [Roseovarius sp. TE539]|uniref:type II toxin-antitoxin system RelE/ParE family toxin n=1 Tax=Roseovarius sp. TE539 TaxID=2249812 RepID=UPI001C668C1F|nr:type II toxin-antitoxin system RelE/ParE family toxin [Roseovarius sp. TE539]